MTMPAGYDNKNNKSNNNNDNSNNIPLSRKQERLLEHKTDYEARLEDVMKQIKLKEQHGKSTKKLQDVKSNLEAELQRTWINIQQEEQKQQDEYLKKYDPQKYRENEELRKVIAEEQYQQRQRGQQQQKLPGEGKRNAGKALIVFGIFITVISFFAGSWGGGILGIIINIIGIALYASGNKDQGRSTTFFGGGFVSSGGD